MVEGRELWLSHRPRPLRFVRATDIAIPTASLEEAEVRLLDPFNDRAGIAELLLEVWAQQDPYVSYEDPAGAVRKAIERSFGALGLGAVATDAQGVCATVLAPSRAPITRASTASIPTLEWLTVRWASRERGLATALLGVVVAALAARGVRELASEASPANVPSLRWHLTRGFRLQPDPIREVQRRH